VLLPRPCRVRPVLVALAVCAVVVCAGAARADAARPAGCQASAAAVAPGDDIWAVSTRGLPAVPRPPSAARVAVERYVPATPPAGAPATDCPSATRCGGRRWERSDIDTLFLEQERPLVVFIHGNRYDHADARQQGVLLAARMAECCSGTAPAQTVIFSWPSEQQGILLRDGRAKLDRARADAHYLAWFLGRIAPARPVAIVGYSFGAVVSLGALDDLASGLGVSEPDGTPWTDREGRTHLVLVAPAVRCDCLAARGPHREAALCIDRLSLVINSEDEALRFFPLLERDVRVQALGEVGMPRRWLPPGVEFTTTNAAPIIGRQHSFLPYLGSNTLTRRICTGAGEGLDGVPATAEMAGPAAGPRQPAAADAGFAAAALSRTSSAQ
jgi:esterase/lipase superfamily enzyme